MQKKQVVDAPVRDIFFRYSHKKYRRERIAIRKYPAMTVLDCNLLILWHLFN